MPRWRIVSILLLICMPLTGCWDKIEIEQRAFVTSMGIDKFDPKEAEKKGGVKEGQAPEDIPRNRYIVTYRYPNTGLIAGKGEGKPGYQLSSVGRTLTDVNSEVSTKLGANLFFGHLKLVVIGEDLAEDEELMREVLDYIERNAMIGRKINYMITPGKAKEFLEVEVPQEPAIGLHVRDILEQSMITSQIADADLGYILRALHESKAAIAPKISASKEELKVAGAAVLKDYKKVGWLGDMETGAVMFMLGKIKTTEITVTVDKLFIPVTIYNSRTDVRVEERDGQIYAVFDIENEGELSQHLFEVRGSTYEDAYLQKVAKAVSEKIKRQVENTFIKTQKEYGADVVQINEQLRKHKPDLWEKVRDDWEKIFPQIKVDVNVETKIRRIGVVR
ncbi:Ger(x)C family germination protein [Anaerosolibacter carboniphilus]|uniref:Ger(X)C family germination protein n=1 Tax=Anaerosolibacter carboniphilus TaxID=1417629 RepID=A0A841KP61_9FIRM|nr:Ger(x)C family germination protein [Anaerosolibacter carboniphilus]